MSTANAPDSRSSCPRRRADVVRKGTPNETLLYDPRADAVHVLNRTALAVWDLCDGTNTAQDIESTLRGSFAVDAGRSVADDVRRALERFTQEQLLEPATGH